MIDFKIKAVLNPKAKILRRRNDLYLHQQKALGTTLILSLEKDPLKAWSGKAF